MLEAPRKPISREDVDPIIIEASKLDHREERPFRCGDVVVSAQFGREFVFCEDATMEYATDERIYMRHICPAHDVERLRYLVKGAKESWILVEDANSHPCADPVNHPMMHDPCRLRLEYSDEEQIDAKVAGEMWVDFVKSGRKFADLDDASIRREFQRRKDDKIKDQL